MTGRAAPRGVRMVCIAAGGLSLRLLSILAEIASAIDVALL